MRLVTGTSVPGKRSSEELCVFLPGQVSPVLAGRTLGTLSVFCCRPFGSVQHAAVCLARVQSHRRTSEFRGFTLVSSWNASGSLGADDRVANQNARRPGFESLWGTILLMESINMYRV